MTIMIISSSGRHQVAPLQMMMMMMMMMMGEEEEEHNNNNLTVTKLDQLLTITGRMRTGITSTVVYDFF